MCSRMKRRSPPPGAWLELLARSRSPSSHSDDGSRERSPGAGGGRQRSKKRAAHEERLAQTIAHEVARAVDEKLKHLTTQTDQPSARRDGICIYNLKRSVPSIRFMMVVADAVTETREHHNYSKSLNRIGAVIKTFDGPHQPNFNLFN